MRRSSAREASSGRPGGARTRGSAPARRRPREAGCYAISPVATRSASPPRRVFAGAAGGDAAATAIVETLAGRLGRGIATVATVLDPELVVLGGGVANAGPALLEPVRRQVRAHTPIPPRVELSALGDESVAVGAVRLALNEADGRLFVFDAVAT